jgi:ankyrin repeat protein
MSDLQSACRQGGLPLLLSLLSQHLEALSCRDALGWTPLYRAVIAQQEAAVSLLLSKGADPNIQNSLGETVRAVNDEERAY